MTPKRLRRTATCATCCAPLPTNQRADARFCSRLCYNVSRQKPDTRKECVVCGAEFSTRYSQRQKYCSSACMWYRQQLDSYGLTVSEYRSMLATGTCAACGLPFEDEYHPSERRPYVDHCHETGKVRGLVHHKCNAGLGAAGDDHGKLFNWQVHLHRTDFDLRDLCVSQ